MSKFLQKCICTIPHRERESSGPGTRAPRGTRSGNIPRPSVSHHSQVKKTSRKWCELLLTKNSNDGGRDPKLGPPTICLLTQRTVRGAYFHIIDSRFFFFPQEGTFSLNLLSAFCVFGCLPSKRAANPLQVCTEVGTIFFPSQLGLRQPGEVVLLYTSNTQHHIQQGVKKKY